MTLQGQVDALCEQHGYEAVRNAVLTVLKREILLEAIMNLNTEKGEKAA